MHKRDCFLCAVGKYYAHGMPIDEKHCITVCYFLSVKCLGHFFPSFCQEYD